MASKKCVVLLSGGPDSATVAYWAKRQGYEVNAIVCKYGQIATKEVESATQIAENLGATIKVIDLSSLKEIFVGVTSLVDDKIPMTASFSQPIIVPFRNAIFLSAAVAYAIAKDASRIYYGAQGSDAAFYPDCRREFYESFQPQPDWAQPRKFLLKPHLTKFPRRPCSSWELSSEFLTI